ncbi:MAG TPA: cupin domain-containing protein [Dehalococcoidia bacterium]|nr:cupin domain-containing protein [Dehalococcoidia bacterium]
MHASKNELPLMLEAGPSSIRGVDWGDMRLSVVSVPAGTDFAPLLKGLPNDRCQGPHWGYVLKGRIRIQYAQEEEVLASGDFFYMPPDHSGIAEEDTEFLEIAPPHLHEQFLRNAKSNLEAMQAS